MKIKKYLFSVLGFLKKVYRVSCLKFTLRHSSIRNEMSLNEKNPIHAHL